MKKAKPSSAEALKGEKATKVYTGLNALQVAMPIGGIGAGCICLNGQGGVQDFSIRHHPDCSALPDSGGLKDAAFALLHIRGKRPLTRLIEGPMPPEKIYDQGLRGNGYLGGGHEGFPRFANAAFRGEYPFGYVTIQDPDIPICVELTGFNPFIPLDDRNSSIPCAILEYTLENRSKRTVDYDFIYSLSHLALGQDSGETSRNTIIRGAGVFFRNTLHPNDERFGSASVCIVGHTPSIKARWFRGGLFDSISVLWREVSSGTFQPNDGSDKADTSGRNGGSILLAGKLRPGEKITYPVVITWHFPNCNLTAGQPAQATGACDCGSSVETQSPAAAKWRPYYASQWKDARDVALCVLGNYAELRKRTQAFHDALFSSTLPSYVLEAVSANLAILKSPTVLIWNDVCQIPCGAFRAILHRGCPSSWAPPDKGHGDGRHGILRR